MKRITALLCSSVLGMASGTVLAQVAADAPDGAASEPLLQDLQAAPGEAEVDGAAIEDGADAADEAPAERAQDLNDGGIEEIIVTASKKAVDIQQVPLAVSAMGAEQLEMRGITETTDLMGSIPNLQITSPYQTSQPNFNLRGVGVANEFNANAASPIGVYVDEVYQSFRAAHGQQLFDLDRVEVVRGPQGTLYGRNTTGGAVNFYTKKPKLGDSEAYVTAGYGNYNRMKLEGAYEDSFVPDQFGFRIAATRSYGDGDIKNKTPDGVGKTDKDYNSIDSTAVRLALRYKPNENWDINLKLNTAQNKPIGDVPEIQGLPGLVPDGTDSLTGYSREGSGLRSYEAQADSVGRYETGSDGLTLSVVGQLSDSWTFTSISGWDHAKYVLDTDCDGSSDDLCDVDYDSASRSFNQDFRLAFQKERFDVIVGAYYGQDIIDSVNNFRLLGFLDALNPPGYFNPPIGVSFFDPNAAPSSILIVNSYEQVRESAALYAEANFDLSEQLTLTTGLRYTQDKIEFNDVKSTAYDNTGLPRGSVIPEVYPYDPRTPGYSDDADSDNVSGRVILSYRPTENAMLYASYSAGYRAGTYNGQSYSSIAQVYFVKPEKIYAYEGGFKSKWLDNRFQLNGATFLYDYKNQQVQENTDAVGYLRNVNGQIYGAEFEAVAAVTRDIRINSALGLLKSEYDTGQTISQTPIGGNDFPFAPALTFNTLLTWNLGSLGEGAVIANAEAQYMDSFFFDPRNDRDGFADGGLKQDAYWLGNARLSWLTERVNVALWIKNLADTEYNAYGLGIDGFGYNYFVKGLPRTFGAEVTYRF